MSSVCVKPSININLNLGHQLTSVSCGHIVAELIKFIVSQRLQIPCNYQWLKQIVNKRKMRQDDEKAMNNFQVERHFRVISTALESLDFILKSLLQEISGPSMPMEVCLTLGATPVTCKEVYRLILPSWCHKPQCHSTNILKDQKLQCSVFKTLVTSEVLSKAFSNPLPPTNMHVFIRKKVVSNQDVLNSENFLPASGSRFPRSSQVFVIDFRNPNMEKVSCCNEFEIFGDIISDKLQILKIDEVDNSDEELCEIQSTESMKWYQSTYVMKGFKDYLINGSSVTNKFLET